MMWINCDLANKHKLSNAMLGTIQYNLCYFYVPKWHCCSLPASSYWLVTLLNYEIAYKNMETCGSTAVMPAILGREKWYMHNILDYHIFKMCLYLEHYLLKALGGRHENNSIVWIVVNCLPNIRLTSMLNYKLFGGIPSVLLPIALVNSCVWEEWMSCRCKQSKYFRSEHARFWIEQGALQHLCQ